MSYDSLDEIEPKGESPERLPEATMYARTTFLIGVWAMTVTASGMAQTPPAGGGANPVPKAQADHDQIVVSILKEVHNRGAELYNRGDAAGCYRMYEGALVTVKAFLTHRPAVQKVIDAADKRHIPAGSWFGKTEQQLRAIKQGARFICHSNDSSLLKDIMTTVFGTLRNP